MQSGVTPQWFDVAARRLRGFFNLVPRPSLFFSPSAVMTWATFSFLYTLFKIFRMLPDMNSIKTLSKLFVLFYQRTSGKLLFFLFEMVLMMNGMG